MDAKKLSESIAPFLEDAALSAWIRAVAISVSPFRYEVECRLVNISADGQVSSSISQDQFLALRSAHFGPASATCVQKITRIEDRFYGPDLRQRVVTAHPPAPTPAAPPQRRVAAAAVVPPKERWTYKRTQFHRDFRVLHRPLGIRLSIKIETLVVAPQADPSSSLSWYRVAQCWSLVTSDKHTQTDFRLVWQGRTPEAAVAADADSKTKNEPRFEVEVELILPGLLSGVLSDAESIDKNIERTRTGVGQILLQALALQGAGDQPPKLLPLV